MNDNRTHIYRIRRKADGLFLMTAPCKQPGPCSFFGPTGCFWKKPETIRRLLLELCTVYMYCGEGTIRDMRKSRSRGHRQRARDRANPFFVIYPHDTPMKLVKIHTPFLEKYEVLATEITEHGCATMEAVDFASVINDEEKKPLPHSA